jgi:hypothetical protein
MPTENPRLRDTAYEVSGMKINSCSSFLNFSIALVHDLGIFDAQVALVALATNPSFHKDLLATVKSWPPVIYSALPVISAIDSQLNTSSMTDALKEVGQRTGVCCLISEI